MVTQNKYLKECFKKPPLTAFRRQTNLRNFLIRSKVAPSPPPHGKPNLNGMNTCGKSCAACPYVQKGKYLKIVEKNRGRRKSELQFIQQNLYFIC